MFNSDNLILRKMIEVLTMQNCLNGMSFILVMDRKIDNHYISPGGYELANGKRFDFLRSVGKVLAQDRHKVKFNVSVFDKDYAEENNVLEITEDDLKQNFTEFYVHTGEYDDPKIKVTGIEDLVFYLGSGDCMASNEQLESIRKSWEESD